VAGQIRRSLDVGLAPIDVDGRAATRPAWQCEGVGVGGQARADRHSEGAVPPRAQLTDIGSVEQPELFFPKQHCRPQHRVDPARVQLRRVALRSACAAASSSRTVAVP
jgi:hypothetical protein